jgi:hypothetical protein
MTSNRLHAADGPPTYSLLRAASSRESASATRGRGRLRDYLKTSFSL